MRKKEELYSEWFLIVREKEQLELEYKNVITSITKDYEIKLQPILNKIEELRKEEESINSSILDKKD